VEQQVYLTGQSDGCTYNQRALVVLLVLFKKEDIDAEGCCGVEEGEDTDGDEKFSRGRVVANQEDTILVAVLTGGGIEVFLVESDRRRVS